MGFPYGLIIRLAEISLSVRLTDSLGPLWNLYFEKNNIFRHWSLFVFGVQASARCFTIKRELGISRDKFLNFYRSKTTDFRIGRFSILLVVHSMYSCHHLIQPVDYIFLMSTKQCKYFNDLLFALTLGDMRRSLIHVFLSVTVTF